MDSNIQTPTPITSPPVPLNTKPVAAGGVTALAVGVFGPLAIAHLFPHAPNDVKTALDTFFMLLATGGGAGAYFGMPFTVKS